MAITGKDLLVQLVLLTNATGGHKEQADRYRVTLEQVLKNTGPELIETLNLFIEASKFFFCCHYEIIFIYYGLYFSC